MFVAKFTQFTGFIRDFDVISKRHYVQNCSFFRMDRFRTPGQQGLLATVEDYADDVSFWRRYRQSN